MRGPGEVGDRASGARKDLSVTCPLCKVGGEEGRRRRRSTAQRWPTDRKQGRACETMCTRIESPTRDKRGEIQYNSQLVESGRFMQIPELVLRGTGRSVFALVDQWRIRQGEWGRRLVVVEVHSFIERRSSISSRFAFPPQRVVDPAAHSPVSGRLVGATEFRQALLRGRSRSGLRPASPRARRWHQVGSTCPVCFLTLGATAPGEGFVLCFAGSWRRALEASLLMSFFFRFRLCIYK